MPNRLAILIALAASAAAAARADLIAEIGAPASPQGSAYTAGDVVLLSLALNGQASRIAAGEIDVHCTADTIHIAGVEFDGAFPLVLSKNDPALPAQRYSATRGRNLGDMRQSDAETADELTFATISVEILRIGKGGIGKGVRNLF